MREYKENQLSYSYKDNLTYDLRTKYRLIRKSWSAFWRKKLKKDFSRILYVTIKTPPFDYIDAFQKQYPDKKIDIIIPIIGSSKDYEKFLGNIEYSIQDKNFSAKLYKLPQNTENVQIYGIFSDAFSNIENREKFSDIKYLTPFLKCVKLSAKKIKPDIIHSDEIPFFLGGEFEKNLRFPIKVIQTIVDFEKYDRIEPFWAILNIVNKSGMKRICRDKYIQKNIASLFNIHSIENVQQMQNYLEVIYNNYLEFKSVQKEEDDIIFKKLNARIIKIFPECFPQNYYTYNSIFYTLKRCDFWAVVSKSYYKNILNNELQEPLNQVINQTKHKSDYILYGSNIKTEKLYSNFDENNFREERLKNKEQLLKEFSKNRIETKFTDSSLFEDCEVKVCGYLDSFYNSILLFATFNNIFNEGVDIAVNSILKLFEMNKNIKFILNIKDGLGNNYIKGFVDLCERHPELNGRWLFIDGTVNIPQFLAASDLILMPYRKNYDGNLHFKALKYGCIPVASKNGILNDTLHDIYDDMTTGCSFKTDEPLTYSDNPDEIFEKAILKAINFYSTNPSNLNIIVKNCLNYDVTWNFDTIEKYNDIYENLI